MKKIISTLLAVSLAMTPAAPAAAQGFGGGGGSMGGGMVDMLMSLIFGGYGGQQGCNQGIGNSMSNNLRSALDNSVRRFESSIAPPASTKSLGCLNQLTGINLEQIFSGSGFNLDSILSNMTSGVQNAVAGAMCSFAQQAFSRLTQSLRGGMGGGGGMGGMGGMGGFGGTGGFSYSGDSTLTNYGSGSVSPWNVQVQPYGGSTGGGGYSPVTSPQPNTAPAYGGAPILRSGGGVGAGSGQ